MPQAQSKAEGRGSWRSQRPLRALANSHEGSWGQRGVVPGRGWLSGRDLGCSAGVLGSRGKVPGRQGAGSVLDPHGGWTGNQEAREEVGQDPGL